MDGKFLLHRNVTQLLYEATLDLISSFFNAFSGFYRQGMISLRSSLELTALYIYYFDHPVEFNYFLSEAGYKGPLISELINKHHLFVKKYCILFIDENKLKKELHTEVEKAYKGLSLYVHGRLGKLQTLISLPIRFNKSEISKFIKEWKKIIGLGNTILAVRFFDEMDNIDKEKKDLIYDIIKNLGILEV
ncbi:hypothetical protein KAX08_02380 [candidate division WOR-3 bacterium]|nr:hypothetical protein [candidate division WOR-3 bacterium]